MWRFEEGLYQWIVKLYYCFSKQNITCTKIAILEFLGNKQIAKNNNASM